MAQVSCEEPTLESWILFCQDGEKPFLAEGKQEEEHWGSEWSGSFKIHSLVLVKPRAEDLEKEKIGKNLLHQSEEL